MCDNDPQVRIPAIQGIIRRRILANYRADPKVVATMLPPGMRPKLQSGFAMVGICLIRLEQIRPKALPFLPGISSENAAHRFAVELDETEAVYIPRRDTDSRLNNLVGGRIFPGVHHHARFSVRDEQGRIALQMKSSDDVTSVHVVAQETGVFPAASCFDSLPAASDFFAAGSRGYSDNLRQRCLDCLDLEIDEWKTTALDVQKIRSSFFDDPSRFPAGSIEFDHALLMRDISHEWHSGPALNPQRWER